MIKKNHKITIMDLDCMKLIFKGKSNSGNYNLRNFKLLRLRARI